MKRTLTAVVLASATILTTSFTTNLALADAAAEAEQLFQQGQQLLAEKKVDAACAALERSERLEPRGGTLLSLSYCNEQQGKIALAYAEYEEALRRLRVGGGRQDRERFALERMGAIRSQVVMLTVEVAESVKALNPEIVVLPSKSGDVERKVPMGADRRQQVPLDINGGGYRIEVRAGGSKPFVAQVSVTGNNATPALVNVNELVPEGGGAATQPGTSSPVGPTRPAESGNGQRTLGLVLGGTGLVLAGVGGVFGVLAIGCAKDVREGHLNQCDRDKAMVVYANVANVGIGLGAVGLIVGTVLYVSAPRAAEKTAIRFSPSVGPQNAGLSMSGAF